MRRLSYSALALFERCSYRYYAERVAGLREERGTVIGAHGLKATEVGDAVHRLLELVDLRAPALPDVELVRSWYPAVTDEELERIGRFVASYCESELAARIATLAGAAPERPFAFEHDGVLLHGRLDVLWRDGARALVLDYKTNSLAEGAAGGDRRGRLPPAAARLRARVLPGRSRRGRGRLPLPRAPDAVVSTTFDRIELPALEEELSAAIRRIDAGEFVPTPSDFTCSGCPALDLVCAGPNLRQPPATAGRGRMTEVPRSESRWPATIAVLGAAALFLTLPNTLVLGPPYVRYVVPGLELAVLIPLAVTTPHRRVDESGARRKAAMTLDRVDQRRKCARARVPDPRSCSTVGGVQGRTLLYGAFDIWVTNVIVFALWYWELDGGGPPRRLADPAAPRDFAFVQMTDPEVRRAGWHPRFTDYLYVAFTNASAFSPTDTMPLTRRAKMLMMLQSAISILTLLLVAARAVNILH